MSTVDWSLSDEALANIVVALPDGTDLGMHPLSDLLVGRNGAPRDPERYARIFSLASEGAKSEWIRLACRIQDYNGTRRTEGANMKALASGLNALARDVMRLPVGSQQQALGGEIAYHQGIIERGLRNYRAATRAQLASSLWLSAAGQHEKARVAVFVAAVEDMSAALVGWNITAIVQAFHHLRQLREIVRLTCDPYPRWMKENAALHIWWARCMIAMLHVDVGYPEEDADQLEVENTPFEHWQWVVAVNDATFTSTATLADEALSSLQSFPSSSIANVVLTIKLLKAEVLEEEKERALLQEVASWDGPDGGVPIAVAKAKLASMA